MKCFLILVVIPLLALAPTGSALGGGEEFACGVTVPNGATPPGERAAPDFHGNGLLWTGLWPGGRVIFEPGGPGEIAPDGSLTMKWWWWRGLDGPLAISGRRLDRPAAPLVAFVPDGYGPSGFQASALSFSSPGCWEVTASVGEASLSFVTLVVRVVE